MTIDRTKIGDQHVIPGAERARDSALAKRRAAQPLRPAVPQKACDVGLFGDSAAQIDLIDMLGGRDV